jgi:YidC/Oxa1 family membrane protein insertase
MFEGVAMKLMSIEGYAENAELISLAAKNTVTKAENLTDVKYVIDMMYNFSPAEWTGFLNIFNNAELTSAYESVAPTIRQITTFLGIDLTRTPWELVTSMSEKPWVWWAVFIPIFAGLFQWLSTRLSQAGNPQRNNTQDSTNPLGGSMKIMNILFPIMSVVFCFMFNGGIGIYWVASSLVQLIIQLLVNAYMNKVDINAMVKKNVDKMNAKRIKKGQKPIKMQNVTVAAQNLEEQKKAEAALKESLKEEQQQATNYYESTSTAKKGSLAEKAGMVRQYEERQKELKSGKK